MIVEQIIEVPANRRITLDIPPQIPIGKVQVLVSPVDEPEKNDITFMSLRGSCKGLDTLDAYFARKRADKALEDQKDGLKYGAN